MITKMRVTVPIGGTITNLLAGRSAEWAKADGVLSIAAAAALVSMRMSLRLTDEIVLDDSVVSTEVAAGRGPSTVDNVLISQQAYAAGDHLILSVTNNNAAANDIDFILDQRDV